MRQEDSIPRKSLRRMLAFALTLLVGAVVVTRAEPARANNDFQNGFEDQLGRIAAFGAVNLGLHVLSGGAYYAPAQVHYYGPPPVHYYRQSHGGGYYPYPVRHVVKHKYVHKHKHGRSCGHGRGHHGGRGYDRWDDDRRHYDDD